jgi:prevent-host-death family protein
MKTMSARDAKHQFGLLIDTARAGPVTVEKHGRPVVVVIAVEEFERLKELDNRLDHERSGKATPASTRIQHGGVD